MNLVLYVFVCERERYGKENISLHNGLSQFTFLFRGGETLYLFAGTKEVYIRVHFTKCPQGGGET